MTGILDEAKRLTEVDRQNQYGNPKNVYAVVARLWTAYLEREGSRALRSKDVAMMMILLKVGREMGHHQRDNIVDIAGYANVLAMIEGGFVE